jgi:uncharacterized protein YbjQ (UPF0145 family)
MGTRMIAHGAVITANELHDSCVLRTLGMVRGPAARSRSVIGNIGAAPQTVVGGNITLDVELCGKARE